MKAAAVSPPLAAILFLILALAQATYIESIAANVDSDSPATTLTSSAFSLKNRRHEQFVPMVAFRCGYRNKFLNEEGDWENDAKASASCIQDKYAILRHCQRVYKNKEITNIVEYSHETHIDKWCKKGSSYCKGQFTVRPYRCIVGEFVTESLQVPSRCRFSHVAGKNKCNDYKYWNLKAESECGLKLEETTKQSMKLRSFAILEPCGLGLFRGVEYVCCPKSVEEKIQKYIYDAKDGDEDDYDDEEEEDKSSKSGDLKAIDKGKKIVNQQVPNFKKDFSSSEHKRFHDAEDRINGSLAIFHDFKALEKQRKFLRSYSRENTPETRDISTSEAEFIGNEKKNERWIRLYKQTNERNHPGSGIQLTLSNVKAEITDEKPRFVGLSTTKSPTTSTDRVVALKDDQSEKEDSDEDQFDDDEEEESSPSIESKLKQQLEAAPKRKYDEKFAKKNPINQPIKALSPAKKIESETEDDNSDEDDEDVDETEKIYFEPSKDTKKSKNNNWNGMESVNVAIEPIVSDPVRMQEEFDEIQPAYARHDMLVAYNSEFREQPSSSNWMININGFTVALVAFAVMMLVITIVFKRRSRHPGFIEVDVCTPEERHVNGMQVNGYENPTYTYFDSKA